ncbi:MAG: DUF559 domain-containing protein [Candidatus Hydrogenedentes bacterium]|nr:DUF559 domain-containing protein [Candidatus Hydrogenedentota bacterium]
MARHKRKYLPYNPRLRPLARALRKEGTLGEVLLWSAVKNRALGPEFHRQVPIGEYIVDFFCLERMLAIEVDGSSHEDAGAYAHHLKRQRELEALGVRFLRFGERDVRKNLEGVVAAIRDWLASDSED